MAAPSKVRPLTSWIQLVEAEDQPAGRPEVLVVGPAGAAEDEDEAGVEAEDALEAAALLDAGDGADEADEADEAEEKEPTPEEVDEAADEAEEGVEPELEARPEL